MPVSSMRPVKKAITAYDPIVELVKVNPVPSLIIEMESLTLAVVNRATADLLGYSEKELLRRSILELVPAEDVARVQQAADKPPPEGETLWRCCRKDRTLLYVKLKYRETVYQDKPARFIVVLEASPKPFR